MSLARAPHATSDLQPTLRRARAVAFAATLGASTIAAAQPNAVDRATAQTLFDDARGLVDAGRYGEACPKFAESLRFDPGLGTMLRLGDCYEKNGQIASAWAMFLDATEAARKTGDSREKIAKSRADALAPRLAKLTVNVVKPLAAGLIVKRDGETIGAALFGTAAPVDAGAHAIEASAPGKVTWRASVDVPAGGGIVAVDVPPLADATAAPPATPAAPRPSGAPAAERSSTLGFVLAGAGVVAVATGVVLFLGATSKHDTAASQCTQSGAFAHCPDAARSDNASAKTTGTVSLIVGGVGVAALATGVVLLATRGTETPAARLRLIPMVGAAGGGLWLDGTL